MCRSKALKFLKSSSKICFVIKNSKIPLVKIPKLVKYQHEFGEIHPKYQGCGLKPLSGYPIMLK
jgi:hypothetical protein